MKGNKMTDKLIVCTEVASFMGGAFDTKEMSEKSHSQAFQLSKKYGGVTNNNKTKISGIYFHGDLWEDMGYDLVNAVGGIIPQLKVGDEIECIAVLPNNKEVNAILHVGNRPNYYEGDNSGLYCLIMYPKDKINKTADTDTNAWNYIDWGKTNVNNR